MGFAFSVASDVHENVPVTDDKIKLPAGNGDGINVQKIMSSSSSLHSRPQSFAQKLRSTSKSVKGTILPLIACSVIKLTARAHTDLHSISPCPTSHHPGGFHRFKSYTE